MSDESADLPESAKNFVAPNRVDYSKIPTQPAGTAAPNNESVTNEKGRDEAVQVSPSPNEGIWMYGIDYLDAQNPTTKDKIYSALEHLKGSSSNGTNGGSDEAAGVFNSLLAPDGKGEQVRVGDLVATYDALALRIGGLEGNPAALASQQSFQQKQAILKQYLSGVQGVDLTDTAVSARLHAFSSSSERYHRGVSPGQSSNRFNRLARRAALLEVYGGNDAQADLSETKEELQSYPEEQGALKATLVQEYLYSDVIRGYVVFEDNVAPVSRTIEAELAGYNKAGLVESEIDYAKQEASQLGIKNIVHTILLGSAARQELRTTDQDPVDPSDIDLLLIVDDNDIATLELQIQNPDVRLSRSHTASGATFYLVKRPSLSKKLGETEVMICTRDGFQKQLGGQTDESETRFVNDAVNEGLLL